MARRKKRPTKNQHHLRPRSRKGSCSKCNLLTIDIARHEAWHKVFGNMTLNEVIGLLIRLSRAKGHDREEPSVKRYYYIVE